MTTKKILITGANSYIGMSFEKWLSQWPDEYSVETVDMIDGSWREKSFAGYDVVFHVAGIVHKKESPDNMDLYMKINCDMAFEVAKKAKEDNVSQFIFMSTMSVYGLAGSLGAVTIIDEKTAEKPNSYYGKSKLAAEKKISSLISDKFLVAILRPPMIYGPNCKGNYLALEKIVKKNIVFPKINNQRSVLSIENFCNFLVICIENNYFGIYFPQDPEYMDTTKQISLIAKNINKKIYFLRLLNPFIYFISIFTDMPVKAFGNLVYSKEMKCISNDFMQSEG